MAEQPPDLVFTIDEVAHLVKVKTDNVTELIRTGDLRALQVGHEWRVLATDFAEFIQHAITESSRKTLEKFFLDPRNWVRQLSPQEKAEWLSKDYPEGSFGDFIKRAIQDDDWLKRSLDNLDQGQSN